ncbi:InlB B-repeat-containing protein [Xylanibacter brevis]|uniref:InlB B-repeat-containing protein n=1 Tax=Xylanibacter brevis TaxID=83231 RepID=UPI000A58DCFE|nr:hypothetical protein [Xylanibacter brevis]
MKTISRYILTLALLLTAVTGAWAQDPTPIDLTPDATGKIWTLAAMPANDIELQVEYFNTFALTLGANANEKGTVEVINELTVNDGTIVNNVVPAYTGWFDAMTKSQYVIPAAKLSTLNGCKIKSMKYYVSENRSWTSEKDIDVYVKEVDYTTMTALEDKANCTTLYTGKLTVANGEAIITFATPYTYNGGNLLVGLENLEKGNYIGLSFFGIEAENASMGGHGDNYNKQGFLPKVTFAYDDPNIKDNGDGTYEVEPGAQITVKATPAEGYYLKNWSDDETNNEAIRTITMESDTTLTAIFDNCAVLTIAANDASMGVAYIVNAQEKLVDTFDTEHTNGTVTYFDNYNDIVNGYWVNNNDNYNYIGVYCKSDNLNVSRVIFYGSGDNSYEASVSGYEVMIYLKNGNTYKDRDCTELLWTGGVRKLDVYATEYALPEGVSETTTPGSYYVVPGSKVPVEAAPFVQYSFSGWSNSETKAAFELTVNETTSLTASFVANPVLTIAPNSAEMGTVSIQTVEGEGLIAEVVAANVEGSVNVEGIDIHAPYIAAEQTEWTIGATDYPDQISIHDQKVSSVVFYGRNGRYVSKCDNDMYTSRTMEPQAVPRRISAMGGRVYLKDGNTYRDGNCTQLLWKGGVTRIEIYGNGTVLPDGVVAINAEAGIYTVAPGTEVTVTATPAEKCHLQSWSDGAELNEQNTNTFTMTAENKNLVASFMPNTYQLVIGAGEFATFYEDWNVKLDEDTPEGVNFYTIASVSGETAVLSTALEGVVAGQTPLLVYNGTETVLLVTIVPTTETAVATPSFAEQFRGTATDREFTAADMEAADFYALSGGKIFVQVEDEGTLAANQCWLQFNHELTSGARSINLVFEDETTAVEKLKNSRIEELNGNWYDMNGRKLQSVPTKKGVYLFNGKKVVVK